MAIRNMKANGTVSSRRVQDFEKEIGVSFPEDYVNFLVQFNGGKPEPNIYDYKLHDGRNWTGGVREFFGFDVGDFKDITFFEDMRGERIPSSMIPIAMDNGGNFVLLTVTGREKGKVYFWDHNEESEDDEPPTLDNLYFVSNSFTEFLSKLRDDTPIAAS